MRKKIDYLELCKLVRAGQAPKKIEVLDDTFEWNGNEYKKCNCIAKLFMHETMYFRTLCEEDTDIFIIAEILDQVEKEYLSAVIKPFRSTVTHIAKKPSPFADGYAYIQIRHHKKICGMPITENINLPEFPAGSMYKNMEIDHTYTLGELGL